MASSAVVDRSVDLEMASSVGNRSGDVEADQAGNEDDAEEHDPRDDYEAYRDYGDDDFDDDDIDLEGDTQQEAVVVDLDALAQDVPPWMALAKFHSIYTFTNKDLFDAMAWALSAPAQIRPFASRRRFLITFNSEADYDRVIRGGPWLYKSPHYRESVYHDLGDALIVAPYDGMVRPSEVKLESVPIWARIYDLPLTFLTERVGRMLGARLGNVLEVDVDESGQSRSAAFVRVRVELKVDRPLLRHLTIRRTGRHKVKYENLPYFCDDCGRIGHGSINCMDETVTRGQRFSMVLCAMPYDKEGRYLDETWAVELAEAQVAAGDD